jgi:hypothetical protein
MSYNKNFLGKNQIKMNIKDIIEWMTIQPITAMVSVFESLAKKTNSYRLQHEGCVPKEIFPLCLAIGGSYPCVEIIVKIDERIAFKRRSNTDQGWNGLFHIPGVVVRNNDNWERILERLSVEIFGSDGKIITFNDLRLIGNGVGFTKERSASGMTVIYLFDYSGSLKDFTGEWKYFDELNEAQVVDHHVDLMKWFYDKNRSAFI